MVVRFWGRGEVVGGGGRYGGLWWIGMVEGRRVWWDLDGGVRGEW